MTADRLRSLASLEGHNVSLALSDGSRIDACQLVSAARHDVRTVWIFSGGEDSFVPLDDIVDLWSADHCRFRGGRNPDRS